MNMTPQEIARLRELRAKATPGELVRVNPHDDSQDTIDVAENIAKVGTADYWNAPIIECDSGVYGPNTADAEYLVAAWNVLPKLLGEIERLQQELENVSEYER